MSSDVGYHDWAEALEDGKLLGARCPDCAATFGTPLLVCPECSHRGLDPEPLDESGTLYTVSRINVGPTGFDAPYYVGIVELGDARLTARIEGGDTEPTIGDAVTFAGGIVEAPDGSVAPLFRTD